MIGAATSIVQEVSTSICTCWTSFVHRVISDGAPNRFTSRVENSPTRWKTAARTSAPKPVAVRAPWCTAAIEQATCTRLISSITPPSRRISPVSPVAMPRSMISAFRLGRYSEAIVPTSCSTTTASQRRSVGPQVGAQQAGEHGVLQGRGASGRSGERDDSVIPPGSDRNRPSQPSSTARTTAVAAPRSAAAAPSADIRTATGERHTTRRASSSATASRSTGTQARVAAAEHDGGHVEQVHRPRERDAQRVTARPQRGVRGGLAPGRGGRRARRGRRRPRRGTASRAPPRARGSRGRRRCTAVRRGRRRRGPARPRGPRTRRTAARPSTIPAPTPMPPET